MPIVYYFLIFIFSLGCGVFVGYLLRKKVSEKAIGSAEEEALRILEDARKDGEAEKKELILNAKEEIQKSKDELEIESKDRRREFQSTEKRLISREETLDRKIDNLQKKEDKLNQKIKDIEDKNLRADELVKSQEQKLEEISGLTREEAKNILIADLDHEIISSVIQRVASDYVNETTVTVVDLPNDDMKGRIIGREGRNIKVLESLTGVDLIIDDTPEAVVLSSFDPIRREVARLSLTRLIQDGRIQPARIEETVEKAKEDINKIITEAGNNAVIETGLHGINPELQKYLGRLKFRTSYGQNVLDHSIEVSHLAGMMAEELGANVRVAKMGGLLHDIGKGIDREFEGTHVELGVNLAKRYKISKEVIHCIEAHHNDVEPQTVEAFLVQAADAISAARPGARRETLESYIKRLEKLEEIANSFDGIEKTYAVQAGREVRILVKPDKVSDDEMTVMAHDIAKRIEEEMQYPGQIKVNVIKEVRKSHLAK